MTATPVRAHSACPRSDGRQRGDRYIEALAIIALAQVHVLADPAAAAAQLETAQFVRASRESTYLEDFANRTRAFAALANGELPRSIELCRTLTASRSTSWSTAASPYSPKPHCYPPTKRNSRRP